MGQPSLLASAFCSLPFSILSSCPAFLLIVISPQFTYPSTQQHTAIAPRCLCDPPRPVKPFLGPVTLSSSHPTPPQKGDVPCLVSRPQGGFRSRTWHPSRFRIGPVAKSQLEILDAASLKHWRAPRGHQTPPERTTHTPRIPSAGHTPRPIKPGRHLSRQRLKLRGRLA